MQLRAIFAFQLSIYISELPFRPSHSAEILNYTRMHHSCDLKIANSNAIVDLSTLADHEIIPTVLIINSNYFKATV